ncbi:deacylase [Thermococcus gorgonarius]|uniref:Deacylase n=1 Tax=Thermococcus gorgonarius TaxID=71997 RepID=A0A2Z2M842_THEGO|nr:M20/M25/M40 family metallo-hydrolase [Thermococcus gorgonarius]ASJ01503.1 deacylase [Thermococcus gorgonarius]
MEEELLKKLVSIPSHFESTSDISNFVVSFLEEHGLSVEYQEVESFGSNVVSRIPGKRLTVILNGHMDTVGISHGWTKNPWGEIEGDKFYGLGSADMKGGLAALISAYIEISKLPRKKRPTVIFTAVVDEEGYSRGTWKLIESGLAKNADVVFIAEPTNEKVMLGARGRFVINLKARGKKAHAARPEKGINAIEQLGMLVSNLPKIKTKKHRYLGTGSYCTLQFTGKSDGLSVPDYAEAIVDRHIVIGEDWERVENEIERLVKKLGIKAEIEISKFPRPTPEMLPYTVRENSRFVSLMKATYYVLFGEEPQITYGQSVGDFNYFGAYLRVPTIVFGPRGANWHSADEWVSLSSVRRVKMVYTELLQILGSRKRFNELLEIKERKTENAVT